MRLLVFTTLYPNREHPHHGVFVENRLRHALSVSGDTARVVAPVPWFPIRDPRFGAYAAHARVPRQDARYGIQIDHPRYPVLPKVGMTVAPYLLYLAVRGHLRSLVAAGERFDLLDAHYFYPDGVAAALLAREFSLPLVITGRGTDLNLIPRYRLPRRAIRWAAERANGLVTVCAALRDDLAEMGVDPERVWVLRNGVDLDMFRRDPDARQHLRAELVPPVLLSVGHLIPRKGHDLAIRALAALGRGSLLIVGDGPEESSLRGLAERLGVRERVVFVGRVPHGELSRFYSAADVLVLASSREGWPNVLLESMACGTPVAATNVNGTPEVVQAPEAGRIAAARTVDALTEAIADVLEHVPSPGDVRRYAEQFSWDATAKGQNALFTRTAGRPLSKTTNGE
jgi:glycosyltransferase involved in cell wall biosynthesis